MDLSRHLRYFLVVAEELHFGHAAGLLGIAQPPLSQSIKRLERELGVELFDRSRQRTTLTTAGQLLLGEARDLLSREERLRTLMRKVREGELGTLRAGVPPETPAPVLQALLHRLAIHLPALQVDLQELTTAEQARLLTTAQLDVGLLHHPLDAPDLHLEQVADCALGVVLPRTAPLARLATLRLADLAGYDLITFPRPAAPGWYDRLLEICHAHGFAPARLRHAANLEFLLGLVLAGHGVAFAQETTARREPRVAWRRLAGDPLRCRVLAAWPTISPHPAADRFAAVAAEVLTSQPEASARVAPHSAPRPWSVVYAAAQQQGGGPPAPGDRDGTNDAHTRAAVEGS